MNDTARNIPKTSVLGIQVSRMGMQETIDYLTGIIQHTEKPFHVITVNPIMVMTAVKDQRHMSMMQRADLIVPDGTGVVWAADYLGRPVEERVAGYDLLHGLMQKGEFYGWRVFLLGTTSDNIREAAGKLGLQYPGIILAGFRDGFFSGRQDEEVIRQIRKADPHILLVGRAPDNQDLWIDEYREQLNVPLMMGIGGSLDIIAGVSKRAPRVWQKLRLEWLYRLLKEPSRYRRMLLLPVFVVKVIMFKRRRS